MTREDALLFVGMAINTEKQHNENTKALKEETGLDYAGVNLWKLRFAVPEVPVMERDMKKICEALSVKPAIMDFPSSDYTRKLSLMIEGVKVFCICKSTPEWAV